MLPFTFLSVRDVGTAALMPSWKASAGLEAHATNNTYGIHEAKQPYM